MTDHTITANFQVTADVNRAARIRVRAIELLADRAMVSPEIATVIYHAVVALPGIIEQATREIDG
jgi:hypothetical protein